MNIPELVGMGLIRQPRTYEEYKRRQQIRGDAIKAAKESVEKIMRDCQNDNSSVPHSKSR